MVFADAAFWIALMNPRDGLHSSAVRIAQARHDRILTTQWVLAESLNSLAATHLRHRGVQLVDLVTHDRLTEVVPADADGFEEGLALYRDRPDKAWSLVDCISFETMRRRAIGEALSADHHFEQAGFRALLRG